MKKLALFLVLLMTAAAAVEPTEPEFIVKEPAPAAAIVREGPAPAPATRQGKQTIAVYMAGKEPKGALGVHNILGGELARTISTSNNYLGVDRTNAILEELAKEHNYQRSGAVSDDLIKSLGEQLGAQYLCIADINTINWQSYYLDVRLIDVVTAEIIRTVTANSRLRNAGEMTRVARSIAYELIETEKATMQRKQKKKILLTTSVSLDILGAGAVAYGVFENNNMKNHIDSKEFTAAENAQTRRNAAYLAGAALLVSGITINIFF